MKYALTETISAVLGVNISESRANALVKCPFHDDRHASLSIDLERGFWICFACGERGGLQSLATRLGKEYSDADLALAVYEGNRNAIFEEPKDFAELAKGLRANLYTSKPQAVVDFVTSRGLSPACIKHFGIGWDGHRIAFPYYDDGAVFGVKYRDAAGNKSSESGTRRGIYNVDDVRFKPYVILCEGESDTLAVWTKLTEDYIPDIVAKFGVGGIPGVSGSKSTWDLWALDLLWAKQVFVAFDADEAGDQGSLLPLGAVGDKGIRMRPSKGKDMTDHFNAGGELYDFRELADATRLIGETE